MLLILVWNNEAEVAVGGPPEVLYLLPICDLKLIRPSVAQVRESILEFMRGAYI